jgi:uncharacterized membrane protein
MSSIDRRIAHAPAPPDGAATDGGPVPAAAVPAQPKPVPRHAVAQAIGQASRWETLSAEERAVVGDTLRRARVARDAQRELLAGRTFGERLADHIAAFGGSWTFILLFFGFLVAWTGLNTLVLARSQRAFDPYPYIFLNLMLSMLAALQAPVIMMSQHRQTVRDRVAAETDYAVNLKAELEIRALHDKLDTLREAQWAELVRMQQEQIALLQRLLATSAGAQLPGAPHHAT